jgi:pre-mRNA-splicing factor CWC22
MNIFHQKKTWVGLKKSINGLINKVNMVNLRKILPDIFDENLVRGRGVIVKSILQAQEASPLFTPVYAALISVLNTKFPKIGLILSKRLVLKFRKAIKRNDKIECLASLQFIAHLVNQRIAHELLSLEIMSLLLEHPTNDSVELGVSFTKEVGASLVRLCPKGFQIIFEKFREILHSGKVCKRIQFIIEGLFTIRRHGFDKSGYPCLLNDLDIIDEGDQITHEISLDDEIDPEIELDVFQVDPFYDTNQKEYQNFKQEVLGEKRDSSPDSDKDDGDNSYVTIYDKTDTNVVNLRRTLYLTIMSSLDFEEAGHKLLKINLAAGREIELVTMIIECCTQERTYLRYFGHLAQRFCKLSPMFKKLFEKCFEKQYLLAHRLETNMIRNVAKLYALLIGSDAISWEVLLCIRLTIEDTTSSGRIFVKILFQEMVENFGIRNLHEKVCDPSRSTSMQNIFLHSSSQNIRFTINFFTSIGLGGLVGHLRNRLREFPKLLASGNATLISH